MNKEKVMGVIRHLLTFGGGYVVAKGWIDEATLNTLIGVGMTVIGGLWSVMAPEKAVA